MAIEVTQLLPERILSTPHPPEESKSTAPQQPLNAPALPAKDARLKEAPPVQDVVQLSLKNTAQVSLAESIHELKVEGHTPFEISRALGVPVQTVSIYLGSSNLETTLASAPTLPEPPLAA